MNRTNSNGRMSSLFVCLVLMLAMAPVSSAALLCGQPFEWLENEPGPVDVDCITGDVYVINGTANLVEGGQVTSLIGFAGSTLNVYGGVIAGGDYGLSFSSGAIVTVYASSAEVDLSSVTDGQVATPPGFPNDIDQLEITDTYVKNIGPASIWFDLVGTYQDANQTPFVIPCNLETNAMLNLNVPQTAPEIDVLPALLSWDMGDVEVGQSTTVMVQIFNLGNADLNVSSVALIGDPAFTFTSGPATPLLIAPSSSIGVDFEVTFTPTAEGIVSATVQVVSDDSDESVVDVALIGNGTVTVVPPAQQIQDILDFFDASVANGTMQGYGPGNSASKRLKALRNMIESASDLINAGDFAQAVDQLESVLKKIDGVSKPQDFAVGEAVAELNAMVEALVADLTV